MSYDIQIGPHAFNYTWNVVHLWHEHILVGEKTGLPALDGLTGAKALAVLMVFWRSFDREVMEAWTCETVGEPTVEQKYNSKNGWGSLVSALSFTGRLMGACHDHPRAIVRVS